MQPRRRRATIEGKKDKALCALLTCNTQAEAAAAAGISERTLRAYLSDASFAAEYDLRRQETIQAATAQLQLSLSSAVAALRDIVLNDDSSDSAKIAAARTLLEHGLRYTELFDLFRRMQAVEDLLQQGDNI